MAISKSVKIGILAGVLTWNVMGYFNMRTYDDYIKGKSEEDKKFCYNEKEYYTEFDKFNGSIAWAIIQPGRYLRWKQEYNKAMEKYSTNNTSKTADLK